MILKKASNKAIRYACLKFHYAKRIPIIRDAYSVFNNNEWCGVICFGSGAGNTVAKSFNLKQGQLCELVRVALNGKQDITSKALAISLKLLKKNNPLIKLVVSYADKDQNHYGTIYQATNWIYLGETGRYNSAYYIRGKQYHLKSVSMMLKGKPRTLENVRKYLDSQATKFMSKGKRKYITIFDKNLLNKYKSISKPYPKKLGIDSLKVKHNISNVEKAGQYRPQCSI